MDKKQTWLVNKNIDTGADEEILAPNTMSSCVFTNDANTETIQDVVNDINNTLSSTPTLTAYDSIEYGSAIFGSGQIIYRHRINGTLPLNMPANAYTFGTLITYYGLNTYTTPQFYIPDSNPSSRDFVIYVRTLSSATWDKINVDMSNKINLINGYLSTDMFNSTNLNDFDPNNLSNKPNYVIGEVKLSETNSPCLGIIEIIKTEDTVVQRVTNWTTGEIYTRTLIPNTSPKTWSSWKNSGGLATSSSSGMMPKLSGVSTQYLNGNGSWATPPDTHYASSSIVGGSSSATANAVTANGSTYLNHIENGSVKSKHLIAGEGRCTVRSTANGDIYINSTGYSIATTQYDGLLSYSDKTKLNNVYYSTSTTGGSFLLSNMNGLKTVRGYTSSNTYNMTTAYGTMYYANFSITLPSHITTVKSINITPLAAQGCFPCITSFTSTTVAGYIICPVSATGAKVQFFVDMSGI